MGTKRTESPKSGKTKKSGGMGFRELLFTYLAVTKVIYWTNTFGAIGGIGEFGAVFLNRMISQDIMVIVILVAMHFLEKHIFSTAAENDFKANAKLYIIGFAMYNALMAAYYLILSLVLDLDAQIGDWLRLMLEMAILYVIISVFLHMKGKLKKKQNEMYVPDADSYKGKIAMLTSLRDTGVLTQAEFDNKAGYISLQANEKG